MLLCLNALGSCSVPGCSACCQHVHGKRLGLAARCPPNLGLCPSRVSRAGCPLPVGFGPRAVGAAVPILWWLCPCLA